MFFLVAAAKTRRLEEIKSATDASNSYYIAIEEGGNIVRIGTKLFGERDYK